MRIASVLAPFLADDGVLLLDGGLATELETCGHDLSDALWSARLLRDAPEAIRAVHEAYYASGARVAIGASYQASYEGFARAGLAEAEATVLLRRSVMLGRQARTAHRRRGTDDAGVGKAIAQDLLVAASVGPYGATRADGSEYTGDYGLARRALVGFHRPRLAVLADAGADLLACETIPSSEEVAALLELLTALPPGTPPAWLSVTCRDDARLRDGSPIEEAAARADACPRIVAFGVNCIAPAHVLPLLERAATATDLPLVAYPNRGERWDARARRWEPGSGWRAARIADSVGAWRAAGARLVGGCCRTGPADIAALAKAVSKHALGE